MTTLSVLKDLNELGSLKIRHLPIPDQRELHKDFDWISNELEIWSKQFADYSPKADTLVLRFACHIYHDCQSKERLLTITKVILFTLYIDLYLSPAREERSAQKAKDLIDNLLKVVKDGECKDDFVEGKRLADFLKTFRNGLNQDQWTIFEVELENGLKSHLDIHCNYWLKDRCLPLKDYVYKRERESFTVWAPIFAEFSVGFAIPSNIRNNQLVQSFTSKVNELGLAVDDYYMTMSKIMTNDITSRIVCLLNEKKCTLQEAFDNQFEYSINLYKECLQLKDQINANQEIASQEMSVWMDSALKYSQSLFPIIGFNEGIQINADQTLSSAKWEQTYKELISKPNIKINQGVSW